MVSCKGLIPLKTETNFILGPLVEDFMVQSRQDSSFSCLVTMMFSLNASDPNN